MEYLFAKNGPLNHAFTFNQKVGGDRSNLSLEFFLNILKLSGLVGTTSHTPNFKNNPSPHKNKKLNIIFRKKITFPFFRTFTKCEIPPKCF